MYGAATKRNKVSSKVVHSHLSQRASNNNPSGTGTSGGGYKILCVVVGLAVITFVTSTWILNLYAHSASSSSVKYSSLSSSRHSGIAEYVIPEFIRKTSLFAQLSKLTTFFPQDPSREIVDNITATSIADTKGAIMLKDQSTLIMSPENRTSLFPSLTLSSIASSLPALNPPLPTTVLNPISETPTLDPTSIAPTLYTTSISPTLNPLSNTPTLDPTSTSPTLNPSTIIPTVDPSSHTPTLDPTSIAPTLDTSTILPTLDPSFRIRTLEPSKIAPDLDISPNASTLDVSLISHTLNPSTIASIVPNLALASSLNGSNPKSSSIALTFDSSLKTAHLDSSFSISSLGPSSPYPTHKPSTTVLSKEEKLSNSNIPAVYPNRSSSTVANASLNGSSPKKNKTSFGEFPMYSRIFDGTKSFVENIEFLTSIDAYFLSSMATVNTSRPIGNLLPLHLGPKNISAGNDSVEITSNNSGSNNAARRCNESFPPRCPNNEEMYSYVRFWNKRFSKSDCYESPLRFRKVLHRPEEEKFLLFEPDRGGWNNIRMAAETAMVLAHASGRTLVLPPEEKWYLLDKNPKAEDNIATFRMFFDLNKVSEAMRIISMEEFIEKVAMKGLLKIPVPSRFSSVKAFIGRPGSAYWENSNAIYKYLEKACLTQKWDPFKTFVGFNLTSNGAFGPIAADSDPRFAEMVKAGRRTMFPYDQTLHNERCLFFPGDYRDEYRLLIHYYAYIYWADKHMSRIYRRIVRDRLHYHDNIFCAAGRIVRALHEDAAKLSIITASNSTHVEVKRVQPAALYNRKTLGGNTNMNATYYAFHIRRGDFQYKQTKLSAERIWENARPLLDPAVSNLIYIATDESDKGFFAPFSASGEFTVRFLRDYTRDKSRFVDNLNHVGMVEQIICANAHTFIGTPFSTFTGYITRMRGYYRDGRYDRTYYTMKNYMYQLQREHVLQEPFWAREFEIAHKNIDDYY